MDPFVQAMLILFGSVLLTLLAAWLVDRFHRR